MNGLGAGVSEPEVVDAYLNKMKHPMKDVVIALRDFILSVHPAIGEGIYWNAPTFYFTGKMKPFDPKMYKRYIIGFNFYKPDVIRMIFLHGALAGDKSGLLEGDYEDGRRLVYITSKEDLKKKEAGLRKVIKELVAHMK